jgi:hypothetical protein
MNTNNIPEPNPPNTNESIYPPAPSPNQPLPETHQPILNEQVQPTVSSPPNYGQPALTQPTFQAMPAKEPVNAGLIILQWLTYAFWGWTVLALSILTAMVIANFINDTELGGFTPYGIAAILVLLPISYICDHFYSKKEPQKKAGVEVLVMVIHAVIFALFGIGSLIFAVFSVVQLFTNSGGSSAAQASLYTSLIIAFYYGITFLRTLNPSFIPWIRRFYRIIMPISIGIIAILGIVGPMAQERNTRDDRLMMSELPSVQSSINNYARANDELPTNLEALTLSGDSKQLVDRKLVTYKPQAATITPASILGDSDITPRATYRYELCVTYKKESKDYGKYSSYDNTYEEDGYASYLSVYSHPAGEVCYKLKTSEY